MNQSRLSFLQSSLLQPLLLKNKQDLAYLLGREIMHGFLLVFPAVTGKKKNPESIFFGDSLEKIPHVTADRLSNVLKYVSTYKILGLDSEINLAEQLFLTQKLKGVKFFPVRSALGEFRQIKSAEEIKKIERAQKLTGVVFGEVKKELAKTPHTENSLARFIKIKGLELGLNDVSFPPIVAAGKNAAIPHHSPTDAKLKPGQSIVLDFGFKYDLYCSDFTRTVFLKSVPKKLESYYEQTRKAYEAGVTAVKDGVRAADVHKAAEEVLAEKGLDKLFTHSLGHGIGLYVHEGPGLSPYSEDILSPGMVFSIEPGVYDESLGGIRIEELFALEKKARALSPVSINLSDMVI